MFEDVGVLPHVAGAHVLGEAGRGGLHQAELLGRLRAVTQRQFGVHVQVGRLDRHLAQILDRELPEDVAGLVSFPHVHLDQTAVGLMDGRQFLTRFKMDNRLLVHRFVWLAPADDRNFEHGVEGGSG